MNRQLPITVLMYFLLSSQFAFALNHNDQTQLLSKAEKFFLKSELDSALKYLSLAEAHYKNTGHDSLIALIANRKARIYLLKEERDSAFSILKVNHSFIKNKFGERSELFAMCNDLLGDCYMSHSDAFTAVSYYRKSLVIRKTIYKETHPRIAFSYSNIARYYSFKMEKDSALYFAKIAYNSFLKNDESNFDIPYERIFMEYAYAYKIFYMRLNSLSQTLEEVRNLYSQTLNFTNKKYGQKSLASAAVYRNIGNTYTDILLGFTGNIDLKIYFFNQGIINYNKSIKITSTILQNKGSALSTLLFVKGLLYEYAFKNDSAHASLELYDRAIQSLVPSYKFNNEISENELKDCDDKYELMTFIYIKAFCYLNTYNKTKDIADLRKALKIAKYMVPLWNNVIEEFDSPYANRLITIYNGKIFNFLVDLTWELYQEEKDYKYLEGIFYYSTQSKGSLQNRLLTQAALVNRNRNNLSIKVSDVQELLPNNQTLYIEFFDSTMAIGISKNSLVVKKINENINQSNLLKLYQEELLANNPVAYQNVSYIIYQSFFAPVINEFKGDFKHLMVASDGLISKVGISGLVTDIVENSNDFRHLNYFGQRYVIQNVLNANGLIENVNALSERSGTILGMVPSFTVNSSLPFSKLLIESIAEKVKGEYFIDEQASKHNFLKYALNHQVIQLSTHAEADLSELMKSKIFFSDKSGDEDFITLDAIYKLKLSSQLAILSACETNIGRMEYGEGSLNFSRAFLYAGCQSTITTQWKVDDKATSNIIMEFYNYLLKELNMSKSLQQAQQLYLKNCNSSAEANPYYWSSLVLTGSDSPVKLKKKNEGLLYGIAVITLLICPAWFWINRNKRKRELNS